MSAKLRESGVWVYIYSRLLTQHSSRVTKSKHHLPSVVAAATAFPKKEEGEAGVSVCGRVFARRLTPNGLTLLRHLKGHPVSPNGRSNERVGEFSRCHPVYVHVMQDGCEMKEASFPFRMRVVVLSLIVMSIDVVSE